MGGGPEDEAPEDEWEVVSPDADVGAGSEPSEPADAQGAEGAKSEEGQEPPAEGDHVEPALPSEAATDAITHSLTEETEPLVEQDVSPEVTDAGDPTAEEQDLDLDDEEEVMHAFVNTPQAPRDRPVPFRRNWVVLLLLAGAFVIGHRIGNSSATARHVAQFKEIEKEVRTDTSSRFPCPV